MHRHARAPVPRNEKNLLTFWQWFVNLGLQKLVSKPPQQVLFIAVYTNSYIVDFCQKNFMGKTIDNLPTL